MIFQEGQNETEHTVHEALKDGIELDSNQTTQDLLSQAARWSASLALPEHLRDPDAVLKRIQARKQDDVQSSKPIAENAAAFRTFVSLQRRSMRMTLDSLAKAADIELEELRRIESEPDYEPRPRTVRQLSLVFKVPSQSMVKLANLKRQTDERLLQGSVAFAACAKDMDQLSSEQKTALKAFVKVLNSIQ